MHPAYAAGIIDGEGCLSFQGIYPRLTVNNTNLELIESLQKEYGGWIHKRSDRRAGYRQIYLWGLTERRELFALLEAIYPYLIVKKEKAELHLKALRRAKSTMTRHSDKVEEQMWSSL